MNKMEVPFNLNWTVKVKLSDAGYNRLAELHNSYIGFKSEFGSVTAEQLKAAVSKDGYTEMQVWRVMADFGGPELRLGSFMEMDALLVLPSDYQVTRALGTDGWQRSIVQRLT
jgi:hypothetical protein